MQVERRRAQGDKAGTTSLLPSVILSERSESKDLVQNIKAVPNTAKEFVTVRLRARPPNTAKEFVTVRLRARPIRLRGLRFPFAAPLRVT